MIDIHDRPLLERHELFTQLVKSHYGCVNWVLNYYYWIQEHEHKDYVQEMMLACWKNFDNYFDAQRNGISFGTWFTRQCKFACTNYRTKLKTTFSAKHRFIPRMVFYENMEQFDVIDNGEDMNPHIDGIIRAVNDLTIEEQKIVHIYLTTDSLHQLSIKEGRHPHYYAGAFANIKTKIRKNKDRYFSGITVRKNKSAGKIMRSKNNILNKPVLQIDIITGKVINTFDSMIAAEEKGFRHGEISKVCNGRNHSHGGYLWRYSSN